VSKLGGDYIPTGSGLSEQSKNLFDQLMDYKKATDEDKIKYVYKYFWVYDLQEKEDESPEVEEVYEEYRKFKEL